MNNEQINAQQFELLRPANNLKPGAIVYWCSGSPPATQVQVVATPGPDGDAAVRDDKGNLRLARSNHLKLSPLFWLEGKPVYPGDKLYWADHTTWGSLEVSNTHPDGVIGNTPNRVIRIRERFLSWNEVRWLEDQLLREGDKVYQKGIPGELTVEGFRGDLVDTLYISSIHINCLTRIKPEPEVLVEGQPVVVGETLFHKSLDVTGVVDEWGAATVYINTGRGVAGFSCESLTRTDPTILFEVEGRPVRKGDKLFSTNAYHYGEERTIVGVNEHGVYSTPDSPHKGSINELTWEAPTLVEIDGVCVRPGDALWRRDTGYPWVVVSFNKLHKTLFCKNMQGGSTSFKADQVSVKPPLFHLKGKAIFAGDRVWTLSGDEVTVKRMEHGKVITSPSDWCFCTVFDKEWLSLTPIPRIAVDGEPVDQADLLYFRESGEEFKVYRQVLDVLEDCKGRKAYAHQLTYSDPKQELVEVPIWVNCYDDGTIGRARLSYGNYPLVGSLLQEVEGAIKVPKHIADKLKR